MTDADRAVETALRARLEQARPAHSIIGEELGGDAASECRWYLDPIDGTDRFAAGEPGWYTLIALAADDDVILGVVSAPSLGRRWWASRRSGAFCNGRRLHVSRTGRLAQATVNDDWRHTLASGALDHPLARDAFDGRHALVSNGLVHAEALRVLADHGSAR